jgi:hypothetical protein
VRLKSRSAAQALGIALSTAHLRQNVLLYGGGPQAIRIRVGPPLGC